MKKVNKNKKITTKEIAQLSEVSLRTADRIKAQIKKTFNVNKVLYSHYLRYYCE